MKAIQFKKSDCQFWGNNIEEITKLMKGEIECEGRKGGRINTLKADNGQEKIIRLGDWILEIDDALVVLSNEEYQLLQSEQQLNTIKDQINSEVQQYKHHVRVGLIKPKDNLGDAISNAVRKSFQNEKRQSGLLAPNTNAVTLNIQWPKL